ncbi:MAG: Ig-like domain-containing protein [Chloroflexota bacterium]
MSNRLNWFAAGIILALACLAAAGRLAPLPALASPDDAYPVTVSILSITPNPAVSGEIIQVSVQVSAVDPPAGIPGGTVQVRVGSLLACQVDLDPAGQGACELRVMDTGQTPVLAVYLGSPPFLPGASAASVLQLSKPLWWPTVYWHDFETPAGAEWSSLRQQLTPSAQGYLGGFNNEDTTLTLGNLAAHHHISVSFDLYLFGSWDGSEEQGSIPLSGRTPPIQVIGPDLWQFEVDGAPLLQTTFSNWDFINFRQAFPLPYPQGSLPAHSGAAAWNTLGHYFYQYPMDSTYHLTFIFKHTAPEIDLRFLAQGLQEITDESWGLDNLWVQAAFDVIHLQYLPVVNR